MEDREPGPGPGADGVQGQAAIGGERPERVWHYDEEFLSGAGSPKPPSAGSPEQGDGFVALNLSSAQQEGGDSRGSWVLVERPGASPGGASPGAKATSSPSEEEEELEVLQPEDQASPGAERRGSSPGCPRGCGALAVPRVDRLELSVGAPGHLPAVTPTSPAEALAEGVLTQVSTLRSEERRVGKECLRLCRSRWSPYH